METPNILIFTYTFPYGDSEQFMETEIAQLARHSDFISLLPSKIIGKARPIPKNVKINHSFAEFFKKNKVAIIAYILLHPQIITKCIVVHKSLFFKVKSLKRMIQFLYKAYIAKDWIDCQQIENSVLYTYWFDFATYGLSLGAKPNTNIKVKSRAHSYDLYEERHKPPFWPFRKKAIQSVDELFLISKDGVDYLNTKYAFGSSKYKLSRLGVSDPGFTTKSSSDNLFRIISCSFMEPVKRLDLLLKAIIVFSKSNPSQIVEWYHIGDGSMHNMLKNMIRGETVNNLTCHFKGLLMNKEVISFYKNQMLDVFVNVSEYEGIPVSIMEAQSCGIPVIATAVGGVPEIVSNENGILLSKNPSIQEINLALSNCLFKSFQIKKEKSKSCWKKNYNAEINYCSFYELLVS